MKVNSRLIKVVVKGPVYHMLLAFTPPYTEVSGIGANPMINEGVPDCDTAH